MSDGSSARVRQETASVQRLGNNPPATSATSYQPRRLPEKRAATSRPVPGITSKARRHQELVGFIALLGRSKRKASLVLATHRGLARSGLHQMEPPNKLNPSGRVSGPPKSSRKRPGSPTLPLRSAKM